MYPKLKMKMNKLKRQHHPTILTVVDEKHKNPPHTSNPNLKSNTNHNKIVFNRQKQNDCNLFRQYKHIDSLHNQRQHLRENNTIRVLKQINVQKQFHDNKKVMTKFPCINGLSQKYNHLRGKRRSLQLQMQLYKQNSLNQTMYINKNQFTIMDQMNRKGNDKQLKNRQQYYFEFSKCYPLSNKVRNSRDKQFKMFSLNKDLLNKQSDKYNFIFNHNQNKMQTKIIDDALRGSINGWRQLQVEQAEEDKQHFLQSINC